MNHPVSGHEPGCRCGTCEFVRAYTDSEVTKALRVEVEDLKRVIEHHKGEIKAVRAQKHRHDDELFLCAFTAGNEWWHFLQETDEGSGGAAQREHAFQRLAKAMGELNRLVASRFRERAVAQGFDPKRAAAKPKLARRR